MLFYYMPTFNISLETCYSKSKDIVSLSHEGIKFILFAIKGHVLPLAPTGTLLGNC
jgi:hypothetical protein